MSHQTTKMLERLNQRLQQILWQAQKGDFISTFNVLSYFCEVVQSDEMPDIEVVQLVAKLLQQGQPVKRYKNRQRQRAIVKGMDVLRAKSCSRKYALPLRSSRQSLSRRFGLSEERLNAISGKPINAVVDFCEAVNLGEDIGQDMMLAVLPSIRNLCNELLTKGKKGERIRSRLGLSDYGVWSKPTEQHIEIVQDFDYMVGSGVTQSEARALLSERTGFTKENIKKIVQRAHKKRLTELS